MSQKNKNQEKFIEKKGKSKKENTSSPKSRFPHMDEMTLDKIYEKEFDGEKAMKKVIQIDYERFIREYPKLKTLEKEYSIIETKGDLFSSKDSLAHCVSEDLGMGKGIAVGFVKNFGQVDELKAQKKQVGDVAYLKLEDRIIFYMITKHRYFNIPSYENVWKSLCKVSQICVENKIKSISMPVIACGLDRLEWKYVKDLIEKAFKDTKIQVTIYVWEEKK